MVVEGLEVIRFQGLGAAEPLPGGAGVVSPVSQDAQFVLIKTPVNRRLEAGFPLQSYRDGELTGELTFSPEQSFGFMTADIREGNPEVGDAIYLRHTPDFEDQYSDRMKFQMEQFKREQEMSFFERRKYEREQKRIEKERKKRGR